ncbi:MAG: EAL domain-containing protein [Pseudomonadota bacterium]
MPYAAIARLLKRPASLSRLPALSFPVKLAALSVTGVFVTAAILSTVGYIHMTDLARRNAFSQLYSEANLNAELIEAQVEGMVRDAGILAAGPTLSVLIQAHDNLRQGASGDATSVEQMRARMSSVFASFIASRSYFTQIRVMTLADNGMEILRVERQPDGIMTVPVDQLQAKGDEPYMQQLITADRAFFSNVSLKRENGKIVPDSVATIRFVRPIRDRKGRTIGAIVINATYESIVQHADPRLSPGHSLTILHAQGDYLNYDQASGVTSLMLRSDPDWVPSAFADTMLLEGDNGIQDSAQNLANGDVWSGVLDTDVMWHAAHVYATGGSDRLDLLVVAHVPRAALQASALNAMHQKLALVAVVVTLTLLVAWFAGRRLAAPLVDLNRAIQSRSDELEPLRVNASSRDEIGRLASAFTTLTNDLISRTNQSTALFQRAADGILTFDMSGTILSTNPSMDTMFGYAEGEMTGLRLSELLPRVVHDGELELFENESLAQTEHSPALDQHFRARHKEGHTLEIEASINLVENGAEDPVFVAIFRDITERHAAQIKLRRQTEALQHTTKILEATFDSIDQGVLVLDNNLHAVVWSSRFVEIAAYNTNVLKRGMPISDWIGHLHDLGDFGDALSRDEAIVQTLDKLGILNAERRPSSYIRARGTGQHVEVISRLLADGGVVITTSDVTRQQEARLEIERLAMTDPLTGLSNRNRLRGTIQAGLKDIRAGGRQLAYILIDLDKFKLVNDVFGHDAGDHVLVEVARRLRSHTGPEARLFRLGGDEFAIAMPMDDDLDELDTLAQTIISDLTQPIRFEERTLEIGASIGIAVAPRDATKEATLLRKADVALYQAKNGGRGLHHFYDGQLDDQERRARQINTDLRSAVPGGQFELFFQPRIEAASMRICGAEALLRWNHPVEGLLPPSEFIPAMERSDTVFEVGEWVIREGWRHLVDWVPRFDMPDFQLSVNVAARQFFEPSLLELLNDLRFSDFHLARNLELELTEEVMIDNMNVAVSVMNKIEELGYTIAIDDFGTGYSSISYLHHMPVRILKIDKSFLEPIISRDTTAAIVKTIINLGRSLGITVTAEGVETAEHVEFLKQHGCTYLQGYYFSKPVPADAFEDMLAKQAWANTVARAS